MVVRVSCLGRMTCMACFGSLARTSPPCTGCKSCPADHTRGGFEVKARAILCRDRAGGRCVTVGGGAPSFPCTAHLVPSRTLLAHLGRSSDAQESWDSVKTSRRRRRRRRGIETFPPFYRKASALASLLKVAENQMQLISSCRILEDIFVRFLSTRTKKADKNVVTDKESGQKQGDSYDKNV